MKITFSDFYFLLFSLSLVVFFFNFAPEKKRLIKWPVLDKAKVTNSTPLFTWVDRTENVSWLPFLSVDRVTACMWSWHKPGSEETREPQVPLLYPVGFLKRHEIWGTGYYTWLWYESRLPFLPSCLARRGFFSPSASSWRSIRNRFESGTGHKWTYKPSKHVLNWIFSSN